MTRRPADPLEQGTRWVAELVRRRRARDPVEFLRAAVHELEQHLAWVGAESAAGAQTLACLRALHRAITEVTGQP